jgi:trk system potassium uptake protein TrkA
VQRWSAELTHVVEGDAADEETLRQLGVSDFSAAVVGIGTVLEASILTTSLLSDLGVPEIWAKALTREHGRILHRVGATRIVYPEREMGEKTARLIAVRVPDYVEVEPGFGVATVALPPGCAGLTPAAYGFREKHGVDVVAVRRQGSGFALATEETVLQPGDVVLAAGSAADLSALRPAAG